MGRPEDDPIGAKPTLPLPGGDAANRGTQLFRQLLEFNRSPDRSPAPGTRSRGTASAPVHAPLGPLPADVDTGPRRYDVALSVIARAVEAPSNEVPPWTVDAPTELADEETTGALDPPPDQPAPGEDAGSAQESHFMTETAMTEIAARPPPGAPTVRRSAPPARPVDAVPQDILETAADTALLSSDGDGRTSFDISFRDELFENLTCRITIDDGRVVALFRVEDVNTRRLLEAEAGRLRATLEERGLRVAEILIQGV